MAGRMSQSRESPLCPPRREMLTVIHSRSQDGLLAVGQIRSDHPSGHDGPQLGVLDHILAGRSVVLVRRPRVLRNSATQGPQLPGAVRRERDRPESVVLGAQQDAAATEQCRARLRMLVRADGHRSEDHGLCVSLCCSLRTKRLTRLPAYSNSLGPGSKREGALQVVSELECAVSSRRRSSVES